MANPGNGESKALLHSVVNCACYICYITVVTKIN